MFKLVANEKGKSIPTTDLLINVLSINNEVRVLIAPFVLFSFIGVHSTLLRSLVTNLHTT